MLHDRPQQWVLESIRQGEVDFGIVIDPGPVSDLQSEEILRNPFSAVPSDHPWRNAAVPWSALEGARLVVQDYASGSRPLIDSALLHFGIHDCAGDWSPGDAFPW